MGSDKRERQKAGKVARAEAARAAQRRDATRRRITTVAVLALVAAALIGVFVWRSGTEETASTSTSTTRVTTSTTTPTLSTVATGTPCVPLADPLPAGAPSFEVPVGVPPTELTVTDLVVGDGPEVAPGGTVTINYLGVSCSTGTIFDDSFSRGEPATFPLSGLIQGWQEGIPGMKVGGQRLLVIPPDKGYGPQGSPGSIAGNETLIFLVQLVDIPPA
jgi:peptidylprolyl isomerase